MINATTFNGLNPLTIRMTGSGEYVKDQVEHLVDLFDYAEYDRLQEIKQDQEYE